MKAFVEPPQKTTAPDPRFWVRYSPRLEFSISSLAAITVHVVLFGLFFLIVARLMNAKTNKAEVPFRSISVSNESGDDDLGSKGSGGGAPIEKSDATEKPMVSLPEVALVDIEKARVSVSQWVPEFKDDKELIDVIANSPARDKLEKMDQGLRNELLKGLGEKKSQGNQAGTGSTGQKGPGEGGETDRATSKRRALGWIIQFNTSTPKNYLDQLAAMKATIIFTQSQDSLKQAVKFTDLANGYKGVPLGEGELNQLYFVDEDTFSVQPVAKEVGLDFSPKLMIALFPKDVEETLAQKAMSFRNLPEDRIDRTTFQILFVNGKYEIRVVSQVAKRGRK